MKLRPLSIALAEIDKLHTNDYYISQIKIDGPYDAYLILHDIPYRFTDSEGYLNWEEKHYLYDINHHYEKNKGSIQQIPLPDNYTHKKDPYEQAAASDTRIIIKFNF